MKTNIKFNVILLSAILVLGGYYIYTSQKSVVNAPIDCEATCKNNSDDNEKLTNQPNLKFGYNKDTNTCVYSTSYEDDFNTVVKQIISCNDGKVLDKFSSSGNIEECPNCSKSIKEFESRDKNYIYN